MLTNLTNSFPGTCSVFWMNMCIIQQSWQTASIRELHLEARTVEWCFPKKYFNLLRTCRRPSQYKNTYIYIYWLYLFWLNFLAKTCILLPAPHYVPHHIPAPFKFYFLFTDKNQLLSRNDWAEGIIFKLQLSAELLMFCAEFLHGCEICLCSKSKTDWCASHDLSYPRLKSKFWTVDQTVPEILNFFFCITKLGNLSWF